MTYAKHAQPREELVQCLAARGMIVENHARAESELARFGYHHHGGYRYVFRAMLPEDQQDPQLKQFRAEHYIQGASFEAVIKLAGFDARLREICLAALLDFERRVRTAIADVVGRRDPFAHLKPQFLDRHKCETLLKRDRPTGSKRAETKFEAWNRRYRDAVRNARSEDFVIHHQKKYGLDLPIWSAMEVLPMGSLPYFLELADKRDQGEISSMFGVARGAVFVKWLRVMSDLRNVCAHSSRLFNRPAKRSIVIKSFDYHGDLLSHLEDSSPGRGSCGSPVDSTYRQLALLSFMLSSHVGDSEFKEMLIEHVETLSDVRLVGSISPFLSPEKDMGFPTGWKSLKIWMAE